MVEDNKLIFVLMMIGLILSDYVIIYFIGNFAAYRDSTLRSTDALRYAAQNNAGLSYDEICDLDLGGYGVVTRAFSAAVSPSDVHMSDGTPITDGYGVKGNFTVDCAADDRFPSKEYLGVCDIKSAGRDDAVILPCTQYTQSLSYDAETDSYGTIEFYDRTLYIIGISTYANDVIIPYALFSSRFEPENVGFYTDALLDEKKSDELRDLIFGIFDCSGLVDPYSYYKAADRGYAALIAVLFIAYLISLLSFTFYVVYFTKRRAKSNAVAYVCGAARKRLIAETLISNEVISVSCFALALVIKLLLSILPDLFYSVKYDGRDIAVMFSVVAAATLIASLPAVRALKKSTASELYRSVT